MRCSLFAITPMVVGIVAARGSADEPAASQRATLPLELTIVRQWDEPVISKGSPGTEGNKYGFEGGRVLKLGTTYHLFTSEMVDDPWWAKMRLSHWTSGDRLNWKRFSTLYDSSGDFTGKDPRAALWSPMPVFHTKEDRWNLFYVAYRCMPDEPSRFLRNFDGRIWRAVSKLKGISGVGGPYEDVGVILEPGQDSQPWEGLQGVDSFFPFQADGRWYGFYGSAQTQYEPVRFWGVGLAESPSLAGPWKRRAQGNPVPLDKVFVENPVVTQLRNGTYAAVFDTSAPDAPGYADSLAIGYSISRDGLRWSPTQRLMLKTTDKLWVKDVRTPLGLVDEDDGTYTLLYTGRGKPDFGGYGCVGLVQVQFKDAAP